METTINQVTADPTDELFSAISETNSEAMNTDDKKWYDSNMVAAAGAATLVLGTLVIANKLSQ